LIAELVGPERIDEGVRAFRERYAEIFASGTTALPGVPRTLAALATSGYRMAVASNKPARFSHPILGALGLGTHFRAVLGPDTAGAAKPDPAMILSCLERMRVTPDEAVYVGDMVLDVESGARAGLPVVLVPSGSSTVAELRATGQIVVESFDDLRALFPQAPAAPPTAAD
jgi:phosphoglycolate phosphatase